MTNNQTSDHSAGFAGVFLQSLERLFLRSVKLKMRYLEQLKFDRIAGMSSFTNHLYSYWWLVRSGFPWNGGIDNIWDTSMHLTDDGATTPKHVSSWEICHVTI